MPAIFRNIPFHYKEDVKITERSESNQNILAGIGNKQDNGARAKRYNFRGFFTGDDVKSQYYELEKLVDGKSGNLQWPDGGTVQAKLSRLQATESVKADKFLEFEAEFTHVKDITIPQITETRREVARTAIEQSKEATDIATDNWANDLAGRASHIIGFITENFDNYLSKAEAFKDFIANPLSGKFGSIVGSGLQTANRLRNLFTPTNGWNASTINTIINGFNLSPETTANNRGATDTEQKINIQSQSIINRCLAESLADVVTAPNIEIIGTADEIQTLKDSLVVLFRGEIGTQGAVGDSHLENVARAIGVFLTEDIQNQTILENYQFTLNEATRSWCYARYGADWQVALNVIKQANIFKQQGVFLAGTIYKVPKIGAV